MLQVEKFVLKISIYILYMFMNIQYIQHNYDYRAVKKIFLVTNDEDLFECYFKIFHDPLAPYLKCFV